MQVKVIPDSEVFVLPEQGEEGNWLIEQSMYDENKARVKGWIDDCIGKNVFVDLPYGVLIKFAEDWSITVHTQDDSTARSAEWIKYFIRECGFGDQIKERPLT